MYEKLLQQCFEEGWSPFVLINHAKSPYRHGVHLAQADSGFGCEVGTNTPSHGCQPMSSRAQHRTVHSLAILSVNQRVKQPGRIARGIGLSEEVPQLVHVLAFAGLPVTAEQLSPPFSLDGSCLTTKRLGHVGGHTKEKQRRSESTRRIARRISLCEPANLAQC